jgi:spore cortex formation protein SpoVR/YcgB (stage V sporulation)
VDEVEKLLDSCHALMNYGVDRYKRPQKISCRRRKPGRKAAKSICKAR